MLPLASVGCASGPQLTLTSLEHHQSYRPGFTQAYINHNVNGDIDVVLIERPNDVGPDGDGPLGYVRQVMHIRILWVPTSDMKAIVSNASVKWYVIGRSSPHDILLNTRNCFRRRWMKTRGLPR